MSNDCKQEHVRAGLSRRDALKAGAAMAAAPFLGGASAVQTAQAANTTLPVDSPAQPAPTKGPGARRTEWSSYGGDKASSKYSPLAQIGERQLHPP